MNPSESDGLFEFGNAHAVILRLRPGHTLA